MGAACGGGLLAFTIAARVSWLPLRVALQGVNCQRAQFCGIRTVAEMARLRKSF